MTKENGEDREGQTEGGGAEKVVVFIVLALLVVGLFRQSAKTSKPSPKIVSRTGR